ncbi:hypothetical protein [Streptomyces sp. NBC_01614]|uniref:hypothetical protein n=1 Tax=Streptomyces sp. NBC_01614 TaxID=2975897 RepID=UPI00386775E5
MAEHRHGRRRVVPAPSPERIMEADTVRVLLETGAVVVCADGGGAPVVVGRLLKGLVAGLVRQQLARPG